MIWKLFKKVLIQVFSLSVFLSLFLVGVFATKGVNYDFSSGSFEMVGVLDIESFPSKAEIFIDGENQKLLTPNSIISVPLGKHKITLKKKGFLPWEKTFEFNEKEAVKVKDAILIPENFIFSKKLPKLGEIRFFENSDLVQIDENLSVKRVFSRSKNWDLVSFEEIGNEIHDKFFKNTEKESSFYTRGGEIWKIKENEKKLLNRFSSDVKKLSLYKDKFLYLLVDNKILICDSEAKNCFLIGKGFDNFIFSQNSLILAAEKQDQIYIWDLENFQQKKWIDLFYENNFR